MIGLSTNGKQLHAFGPSTLDTLYKWPWHCNTKRLPFIHVIHRYSQHVVIQTLLVEKESIMGNAGVMSEVTWVIVYFKRSVGSLGRPIRTKFWRCTLSFLSHLIHGQNKSKTKF